MKNKKIRFPRLRTKVEILHRVEKIIWLTWNKMARDRSFSKKTFGYDIYKTENGEEAKILFMVLAELLLPLNIDPSLYLKVLSKYGKFGKKKMMPNLRWIASNKAYAVFVWLVEKERKKFPLNRDWKAHLNDPEIESSTHIGKKISRSVEIISQTMEGFGCSAFEAELLQTDRLSPWFIACYRFPKFLEVGGDELLDGQQVKTVWKCVRHLLKDRNSLNEAIQAMGDLRE